MAKKETKKKKDLVPVEPIQAPMRFDPKQEIEFASKAAKALTSIIESKPKKVIINGQQYIEFEDWQTIARFFNLTVGTEGTERVLNEVTKDFKGYNAEAVVYNAQGVKIGGAEASCFNDEANWKSKPEFQLKSMAQTRAMAKGLRSILGWVVVLAGYKTTPAEEMDGVKREPKPGPASKVKADVQKVKEPFKSKETGRKATLKCSDCPKIISDAEKTYSLKNFNVQLCFDCQKAYKKKS